MEYAERMKEFIELLHSEKLDVLADIDGLHYTVTPDTIYLDNLRYAAYAFKNDIKIRNNLLNLIPDLQLTVFTMEIKKYEKIKIA